MHRDQVVSSFRIHRHRALPGTWSGVPFGSVWPEWFARVTQKYRCSPLTETIRPHHGTVSSGGIGFDSQAGAAVGTAQPSRPPWHISIRFMSSRRPTGDAGSRLSFVL